MSIVFDLERTNQLNLLPDKDLVDLCPPIEPYQVTKNRKLEGKLEGKMETIPLLVRLGLNEEQIARELNLKVEIVRQFITNHNN